MSFGLFKKNKIADKAFINGHICTMIDEFPWAEALASKDGRIIGLGSKNSIDEYIDDNTEIIDLDGKYVTPGLIESDASPVLEVFNDDFCTFIDSDLDMDGVLSSLQDTLEENFCTENIFAYGFDANIIKKIDSLSARQKLDSISTDIPISLLGDDGFTLWLNSLSNATVEAAAKEDDLEIITAPYALSILSPFDEDELYSKIDEVIMSYCENGYTSVFNGAAPIFFSQFYQNFLIEKLSDGLPKQRFFNSIYINNNVNPSYVATLLQQNRLTCLELNDYIKSDHLLISSSKNSLSENYVIDLCREAFSRNFSVKFLDSLDTVFAYFGGKDVNIITPLPEIKMTEIERRTLFSAENLGLSDSLGSLDIGKLADFTVFRENPFDFIPKKNAILPIVDITVINGEIAYDAEESSMGELYDLMVSQQF